MTDAEHLPPEPGDRDELLNIIDDFLELDDEHVSEETHEPPGEGVVVEHEPVAGPWLHDPSTFFDGGDAPPRLPQYSGGCDPYDHPSYSPHGPVGDQMCGMSSGSSHSHHPYPPPGHYYEGGVPQPGGRLHMHPSHHPHPHMRGGGPPGSPHGHHQHAQHMQHHPSSHHSRHPPPHGYGGRHHGCDGCPQCVAGAPPHPHYSGSSTPPYPCHPSMHRPSHGGGYGGAGMARGPPPPEPKDGNSRYHGQYTKVDVKAAKAKQQAASRNTKQSASGGAKRKAKTSTTAKGAKGAKKTTSASAPSPEDPHERDACGNSSAVQEQQKIQRAKVAARIKRKREGALSSSQPELGSDVEVDDTASGSKVAMEEVDMTDSLRPKSEPEGPTCTLAEGEQQTHVKTEVEDHATGGGDSKEVETPAPAPRVAKRQKKSGSGKAAAAPKKKKTGGDDDADAGVDSNDPAECKKQRRLIRNRMSAQLHRERQRAHVTELESQVQRKADELAFVTRQLGDVQGERDGLASYACYLETILTKHHISYERPGHVKFLLPMPMMMPMGSQQNSPTYSSDTTPCPSSPEYNHHLASIVCSRGPPSPCRERDDDRSAGSVVDHHHVKKERSDSGDDNASLCSSSDQTMEETPSSPAPMEGSQSSILVLAVMFTMIFFGGNTLFDPTTTFLGTDTVTTVMMQPRHHEGYLSPATTTTSSLVLASPSSPEPLPSPPNIMDISVPPPQRGRRSLQSMADAIQLPPPLSPENRVSEWGSKGAGPLVISSKSSGSSNGGGGEHNDAAISKQLQLYRDLRVKDTSFDFGGYSTTNATSWMMCPHTFGGIDLNLTLAKETTGQMATRKNNLRHSTGSSGSSHPSGPALLAPVEWRNENRARNQAGLEFDRKDSFLLLLVPSTSVTWGQDGDADPNQNASDEFSFENGNRPDDSGWVEIGCELMHVRRVPDVEFSEFL